MAHWQTQREESAQMMSDRGIVEGTEYDLNNILFGMGYNLGGNPYSEHMSMIGRGNRILQQKREDEIFSPHGVVISGTPNLFFLGSF
jgi:hypothetical protein